MNLRHTRAKKKALNNYLPMPYSLAAHRTISALDARRFLFNGMLLYLKKFEAPSEAVAVMAYFKDDYHIIGFVPQGFISTIEEVMLQDERVAVVLERLHCEELKDSFWITLEQLPDIDGLSIEL